MNKSQFSFNKSSLISLQAELARKKEEVASINRRASSVSTKLQIKPHIVQEISIKQETNKNTAKCEKHENSELSSADLDHVRESLTVKTKLYDKFRNNELVNEEGNDFLVDFNGKNDEVLKEGNEDYDSDPDSEWVSFVDALGRSRICLRVDLDYYKELDSQLKAEERTEEPSKKEKLLKPVSDEMLLWDKRKEELRKMWEEEQIELSRKNNIHYQDMLFDEARTHGVGYFNFSQDENERIAQQEALKKLREETEENQKITSSIKERQSQLMKQRIAAAKKRKRLQMGLPPEADEESALPDDEQFEEKSETKPNGPLEQKIDEFLNNMKRSTHVRPWDVGKDGVKVPIATQYEWNEKQRAVRLAEFAPPSSYKRTGKMEDSFCTKSKKFKPKKPLNAHEKAPLNFEIKTSAAIINPGTRIPPPLHYDRGIYQKRHECNIEDSLEAGLNYLKNKTMKKSKTLEDRIRQDYT